MTDFTSLDESNIYEFDGSSLYYSSAAPVHWPEESHDRIKVIVPLGATTIAFTYLIGQNQSRATLSPQEIGIIPARQVHQLQLSKSEELMLIFIEPRFVIRAAQGILVDPDWNLDRHYIQEDAAIEFIARTLKSHLSHESPSKITGLSTLYCMALLRLLAVHLIVQYARSSFQLNPVVKEPTYAKLSPILFYIHDHLEEDLKVATLAQMAKVSPPHLSRLFKRATGLSPYRYILLQRIMLAKTLLNESTLGLADIALRCGFYDQSHFNLQFRNHTGMTPQAYRDRF